MTKPRKKTRRSPKKKKLKSTRQVVTSSSGYNTGDEVFVKMHAPPGLIAHGRIFEFYPGVPEGPAFLFWDDLNGKYRTTLVENIIDKPDAKLRRKLNRKK